MMSLKLHRQDKTEQNSTTLYFCTKLCFSTNGSNEFETTFGTDQINGAEGNNIFCSKLTENRSINTYNYKKIDCENL